MAFVAGLSRSQVIKIINNYASIAPATMSLITQLSAQINNPNDPAAALIGQMATIQNNFNSLHSEVQALQSGGALVADNSISESKIQNGAVTENKIQNGAVTANKIQNGAVSNDKLQNSAITINGSSVNLGGSITVSGGGGDSLPSQIGQNGKFLKTDGMFASWATVSASSADMSKNPTIRVYDVEKLSSFYMYGWGSDGVTINKMGGQLSGTIRIGINYVGNFANITNAYNGSKILKVPTYWLTKEAPTDWMNLQYSYVNLSSIMPQQEWNGMEWYTYAYDVYFTDWDYTKYNVYDSYHVVDFFSVQGEVTSYKFFGEKVINSELAYLDGATSNIQTQINSIKKDGVLEAPTINAIDYEQLGNPGSSHYWDGSTQGTFGLNLNNYPGAQNYIDFNENSYNSLDDWFFSIYANMNLSLNEYYIRCEGSYFGTPVFAKINSVTGARVFVEYTDSRYFYDSQTAQPATFTIFTKIVTPISSSEIKALDGITSNIQGQLDAMSDIVDTVPTTVTNTIAQELGSIFVDPTIKRPTIWTESQSGEAFYANSEFKVQTQMSDGIEIYSSSHPSYGINGAALELAGAYYIASSGNTESAVVNNLEIEISGVTGTNANLINGIQAGRLVVQQPQNSYSWFNFRFGKNILSQQTDWSNAKIKWGNIRTITANELKSLDNVSGNIQNQIDSIKTNGVFDFPTIRFGGGFILDRGILLDEYIGGYSYNQEFEFEIYLPSTDAYTTKLKQDMLEFAQKSGNIEDYMGMPQPYTVGTITVSGVVGGDPNINGTHTATITNTYSNPDSFRIKFSGADWLYDPNLGALSDISNLVITCGNTIKITQSELEALDGINGNIQQQIDGITGGGSVGLDILAIQQDISAIQQDITIVQQGVTAVQQDIIAAQQDVATVQQNVATVQQNVQQDISVINSNKSNVINPHFAVGNGGIVSLSDVSSLNGPTMTRAEVKTSDAGYNEFKAWLIANGAQEGVGMQFDLTLLGMFYPVSQSGYPNIALPQNRGASGKNPVTVYLNSPYNNIILTWNIAYDFGVAINNPVIVYGEHQEAIAYNGPWSNGMGGANLVGDGTTTATVELSGSVFIQENLYKILCTTVAGDLANNVYRVGFNNNSVTGKIISIDHADGINNINMTVLLDSAISGTHSYNADIYIALESTHKSISSTEIGYLDGLTGNIQEQINYILSLINP